MKKFTLPLSLLLVLGLSNPAAIVNAKEVPTDNSLKIDEIYKLNVGSPKIKSNDDLMVTPFSATSTEMTYTESAIENGVKQVITLHPQNETTTIEIPYEFNDGESLEVYLDENKSFDGGLILNSDNVSIGLFTVESKSESQM